ncbi:hypothetical protein [Micromonospora sp. NBC_01796]|uniref:hypothetical protein n=1 Tax=Micromonospora sp. NBC_01796 TaxID=2975987 RepID=UPI002DDBC692|nr:hypothetical protein [Micromonospora sp. NBC_01796]WSA84431.1 DUF4287 domain-containing protein [Micromonospora sp. NBC_01796]
MLDRADRQVPPAPSTAPTAGAQPIADETVRERTGRGRDDWFALLDTWGATGRTHTEIARWLVHEHEVPGSWSQHLTVAYEHARGMRAPGQQHDGGFAASVTKIVSVPVDRLFAAFADDTIRGRWLPDATIRVRTATAPKSLRADWADGGARIVVGFTARGETKAQVAVLHEKLPDSESTVRLKAYWRERLAVLKQVLES